MSVEYSGKKISVSFPSGHDVIYVRPEDTVSLEFSTANFQKTLINGDLVIQINSDISITIAEYANIQFDNSIKDIVLEDTDGTIDPQSFITQGFQSLADEGLDVLVRDVASPKSEEDDGDIMPTSEEQKAVEAMQAQPDGNVESDSANPIDSDMAVDEKFVVRTLMYLTNMPEEVPFIYTDYYNDTESDDKYGRDEVKSLNMRPEISVLYGMKAITSSDNISDKVYISHGLGTENNPTLQFAENMFNYSNSTTDIVITAQEPGRITRVLSIAFPNAQTSFDSMMIYGVPDWIELGVDSNSDASINDAGDGTYKVVKSGSNPGGVSLTITYNAYDNPEGSADEKAALEFEVLGYNDQLQTLFNGKGKIVVDGHEVNGAGDLGSQSDSYYNLSTRYGTAHVITGQGNDEIYSSVGGVFEMGYGEDIFYSGNGAEYNDDVNMDAGDDRIYVSSGMDKVDGGADFDTISLDDSLFANSAVEITFGKEVKFAGTTTEFSGYTTVVNVEQFIATRFDDTFTVEDTTTLEESITIDGLGEDLADVAQGGDNAVTFYSELFGYSSNGTDIAPNISNNPNVVSFTNVENFYGSKSNDLFVGSDNSAIFFDAKDGNDTADYSSLSSGAISASFNNGLSGYNVTKVSSNSTDKLININTLIATNASDIIYDGRAEGDGRTLNITIDGGDDTDTLSYVEYENSTNQGVYIDMATNSVAFSEAVRDASKTTFTNIEIIQGSDMDDTIYSNSQSTISNVDLLGGSDTVSYQRETIANHINATLDVTGLVSVDFLDTNDNIIASEALNGVENIVGTQGSDSVEVDYSGITGVESILIDFLDGTDTSENDVLLSADASPESILANSSAIGEMYWTGSNGTNMKVLNAEYVSLTDVDTSTYGDTFEITEFEASNDFMTVDGGEGNDVILFSSAGEYYENSTTSYIFLNFEVVRFDNDGANNAFLGPVPGTVREFEDTKQDDLHDTDKADMFDASASITAYQWQMTSASSANGESNVINLLEIGGSGETVYTIAGFEIIVSGGGNDIISLDYEDSSSNMFIDGFLGNDTLELSANNTGSAVGYTVNLVKETIVTDQNENEYLRFDNMEAIHSMGTGDDVFIFGDDILRVDIDGGEGNDIISFGESKVGKVIDLSVLFGDESAYSIVNVEGVYGTEQEDVFIPDNTTPAFINGLGGIDQISYDTSLETVNLNISDESMDFVQASKTDVVAAVEDITLTTGADIINMSSGENLQFEGGLAIINANQSAEGDRDTLTYADLEGTGVNLTFEPMDAYGNSIVEVTKGENGRDIIMNVEDYVLSNQDDVLNIISNFTPEAGVTEINVDMGAETGDSSGGDVVSFSTGSNLIYDSNDFDTGGVIFKVSNYETVRGSAYSDQALYFDGMKNFDGGQGLDSVDFSTNTAAGDRTFDFATDSHSMSALEVTQDGSDTVEFFNLEEFYGSAEATDIFLIDKREESNLNVVYNFYGSALDAHSEEDHDLVDYSNEFYTGSSFSVIIGEDGIIESSINTSNTIGVVSSTDYLHSIEEAILTSGDDTTLIDLSNVTIDGSYKSQFNYNAGDGYDKIFFNNLTTSGLSFNQAAAENTGVAFDIDGTSGGALGVISSFEVMFLSAQDDIVSFNDISALMGAENTMVIDASDGEDFIDFSTEVSRGLIIDLSANTVKDSETEELLISMNGFEGITATQFDDTIVVATGASFGSIDGGDGIDTLSFVNARSGVTVTSSGGISGDITAENMEGFQLTLYADTFVVDESANPAIQGLMDGADDFDTIVIELNESVIIDFTKESGGLNVGGNVVADQIKSFEIFDLTKAKDATITLAASSEGLNQTFMGNGSSLTIDYSTYSAGIIFEGTSNTIAKATGASDSVTALSTIITAAGANYIFITDENIEALSSNVQLIDNTKDTDADDLDYLSLSNIASLDGSETTLGDDGKMITNVIGLSNYIETQNYEAFILTAGSDTFYLAEGILLVDGEAGEDTIYIQGDNGIKTILVDLATSNKSEINGVAATIEDMEIFRISNLESATFRGMRLDTQYSIIGEDESSNILLDYSTASYSINVDFKAGTISKGSDGLYEDTIENVKNIKYTSFDDSLIINVEDLDIYQGLSIDGGGNGILGDNFIFSGASGNIGVTVTEDGQLTYGGQTIDLSISGFESITLTDGDDSIEMSSKIVSGASNVVIDMGQGIEDILNLNSSDQASNLILTIGSNIKKEGSDFSVDTNINYVNSGNVNITNMSLLRNNLDTSKDNLDVYITTFAVSSAADDTMAFENSENSSIRNLNINSFLGENFNDLDANKNLFVSYEGNQELKWGLYDFQAGAGGGLPNPSTMVDQTSLYAKNTFLLDTNINYTIAANLNAIKQGQVTNISLGHNGALIDESNANKVIISLKEDVNTIVTIGTTSNYNLNASNSDNTVFNATGVHDVEILGDGESIQVSPDALDRVKVVMGDYIFREESTTYSPYTFGNIVSNVSLSAMSAAINVNINYSTAIVGVTNSAGSSTSIAMDKLYSQSTSGDPTNKGQYLLQTTKYDDNILFDGKDLNDSTPFVDGGAGYDIATLGPGTQIDTSTVFLNIVVMDASEYSPVKEENGIKVLNGLQGIAKSQGTRIYNIEEMLLDHEGNLQDIMVYNSIDVRKSGSMDVRGIADSSGATYNTDVNLNLGTKISIVATSDGLKNAVLESYNASKSEQFLLNLYDFNIQNINVYTRGDLDGKKQFKVDYDFNNQEISSRTNVGTIYGESINYDGIYNISNIQDELYERLGPTDGPLNVDNAPIKFTKENFQGRDAAVLYVYNRSDSESYVEIESITSLNLNDIEADSDKVIAFDGAFLNGDLVAGSQEDALNPYISANNVTAYIDYSKQVADYSQRLNLSMNNNFLSALRGNIAFESYILYGIGTRSDVDEGNSKINLNVIINDSIDYHVFAAPLYSDIKAKDHTNHLWNGNVSALVKATGQYSLHYEQASYTGIMGAPEDTSLFSLRSSSGLNLEGVYNIDLSAGSDVLIDSSITKFNPSGTRNGVGGVTGSTIAMEEGFDASYDTRQLINGSGGVDTYILDSNAVDHSQYGLTNLENIGVGLIFSREKGAMNLMDGAGYISEIGTYDTSGDGDNSTGSHFNKRIKNFENIIMTDKNDAVAIPGSVSYRDAPRIIDGGFGTDSLNMNNINSNNDYPAARLNYLGDSMIFTGTRLYGGDFSEGISFKSFENFQFYCKNLNWSVDYFSRITAKEDTDINIQINGTGSEAETTISLSLQAMVYGSPDVTFQREQSGNITTFSFKDITSVDGTNKIDYTITLNNKMTKPSALKIVIRDELFFAQSYSIAGTYEEAAAADATQVYYWIHDQADDLSDDELADFLIDLDHSAFTLGFDGFQDLQAYVLEFATVDISSNDLLFGDSAMLGNEYISEYNITAAENFRFSEMGNLSKEQDANISLEYLVNGYNNTSDKYGFMQEFQEYVSRLGIDDVNDALEYLITNSSNQINYDNGFFQFFHINEDTYERTNLKGDDFVSDEANGVMSYISTYYSQNNTLEGSYENMSEYLTNLGLSEEEVTGIEDYINSDSFISDLEASALENGYNNITDMLSDWAIDNNINPDELFNSINNFISNHDNSSGSDEVEFSFISGSNVEEGFDSFSANIDAGEFGNIDSESSDSSGFSNDFALKMVANEDQLEEFNINLDNSGMDHQENAENFTTLRDTLDMDSKDTELAINYADSISYTLSDTHDVSGNSADIDDQSSLLHTSNSKNT